MKFWCVQQKYFDSGAIKVNTYQIEAEKIPENSMIENKTCDEYHDYFNTYQEATQFAKDARNA